MDNNNRLLLLKNAKNEEEMASTATTPTSGKNDDNNDNNSVFIKQNKINTVTEILSDEFEHEIAKSMQELEDFDNVADSDFEDEGQNGGRQPDDNDTEHNRNRTVSAGSSGSSDADENLIDTLKKAPKLNLITDLMPYQPCLPLNFAPGRRLSECKEETDEEDEVENEVEKAKQDQPALVIGQIERPKIVVEAPLSPTPKTTEVTGPTRRFIVTKASPIAIRREAKFLESMTPKQNSQTIHFPCSDPKTTQLQSLFAQNSGRTSPHVDPNFFDTSLVEIRPLTTSAKSINDVTAPEQDDNVWIKRNEIKRPKTVNVKSMDEADTGADRPHTAPPEFSAKLLKKQKKDKDKEAKRQEKELRKTEKEARRRKEEAARQLERLEREAAKLEKLKRSNEQISRSVERVSGRSGSLERRKSGDDSLPVLNQTTVHGIASPSRRPTIFDVFRPRRGSDPKKKDKDGSKSSGSDKDSYSGSTGGGSGGIMHSMKQAIIGHKEPSASGKTKVKDGSAHPHAGSHAQYYHTVTAVRRVDASKSPMTKVMDLFRHRSNSSVSEAEKRKARAVAQHQQQIAAQCNAGTPPVSGAPPAIPNDPYRNAGYPPQNAQGPYAPQQGPPRSYPAPPQQPPTSASPSPTPPSGPPQPNQQQTPPPGAYSQGPPPQQDYYRPPEQPGQPRRHPDFTKEPQPYPGYGPPQRPQMYGGWPSNNQSQYRPPYPPHQGPQGWQASGPPQRPGPGMGQPGVPQQQGPAPQWGGERFPPNQQPPYPHQQQSQQQWGPQPGPGVPLRGPPRGGKPFAMPPPLAAKPVQGPFPQPPGVLPKREIVFPPDSVEATTPVMYRRKRITRSDIGPTDAWRVYMSLRSGLLHETTWALDVLNILLFDDTAIAYFGLVHMPGLLNLLMEHFQKSLVDMFDSRRNGNADKPNRYLKAISDKEEEKKLAADLGAVTEPINPSERIELLRSAGNYTNCSRKNLPVKVVPGDDDIFVTDGTKAWDRFSDTKYQTVSTIGCDAFTLGCNDPDPFDYIIDTFYGEFVNIPFAKYIKGSDGSKRARVDLTTTPVKKERDDEKKTATPKRVISEENPVEIVKNTISKMNKENNRIIANNVLAQDAAAAAAAATTTTPPNATAKPQNGVEIKRESSDADCREIDMELERIPNGPTSNGDNEKEKETEQKPAEQMKVEEPEKTFDITSTARDPAKILKRRRMSDFEDECYTRDEASLYLITETQDTMARRCICLSNILRNLTFVPGNEMEFARSKTFLAIVGKLLLFNHEHLVRAKKTRNYDREEDADFTDSCSSLQGEHEWWWDYLIQIRENMLVSIANIAGHMDLAQFEEEITRPILDGLLHWAVCPAAHGQDTFPTCGPHSNLSPQRLALECLCKLCVTDSNVDLVIATPPFTRLEKLCSVLTRHLCKNEDQVLREFSVNLLHYLAAADSAMSRTIAMQSPCVSYLVAFIEQAEQTALGVANQHGINFLRENPDSMGTSLDMLRRAAGTLLHLARHPDNRPLFMQQEQRLLGLVMSHILDQQVALIISRVLFQCSRGPGPLTTMELLASIKPQTAASTTTTAVAAKEVIKSATTASPLETATTPITSTPNTPLTATDEATADSSPPAPTAVAAPVTNDINDKVNEKSGPETPPEATPTAEKVTNLEKPTTGANTTGATTGVAPALQQPVAAGSS